MSTMASPGNLIGRLAAVHRAWQWPCSPVAAVAAVLAVAADEQPAIHGEHRRVGDLRGKHGTRRARGI